MQSSLGWCCSEESAWPALPPFKRTTRERPAAAARVSGSSVPSSRLFLTCTHLCREVVRWCFLSMGASVADFGGS